MALSDWRGALFVHEDRDKDLHWKDNGRGNAFQAQRQRAGIWGKMLTRSQWLDRVCALFITEARNYQVWNKVPPEDLDEDIVKVSVAGRASRRAIRFPFGWRTRKSILALGLSE